MAEAFPNNIFGSRNDTPGSFFVGGMNSGVAQHQLGPGEYFFSENTVNRGGLLQTRPGFEAKINVAMPESGSLQGFTHFRPTGSQITYLVFAAGGKVYYAAPPFNDASVVQLTGIQFYPGAPMVIFKEAIKSVQQADDGTLSVIPPIKVLIMQDGAYTRAAYWDGAINRHLNPSPGSNETPLGQAMEWIGDRLWVARGSELFVSDIADPLKFTETNYLFEGLPFQLSDDCTALKATVDQRQLLAFTTTSTTIFQANIRDRTLWKTTLDFQRLLFPNIGCVGPKAITDQYGMLWWFSMGGWINLNSAMQTYRDSQIDYQDREMSRSKGYIGQMLSRICAGSFENYLFVSVPYCDFYNAHTWVMDQAVLDSLGSGVVAAWNSVWTGVRPIEWTSGIFDGQPRSFFASVDYVEYQGTRLRIWEAFKTDRSDSGNPVYCSFESKLHADPGATLCQIKFVELLVSELKGCVEIEIYWRGTRGEYHLCGTKQVNATPGPFGSLIIPWYTDETLLEDYIKQVRQITTQDVKKGLDSGKSESPDTDNTDRAFSIRVVWRGQMSLDAYKISIDAFTDPSQGRVELEECCSGPERILLQSGKSLLVDMPCAGVALFESAQTYTAECPEGYIGDPVTRTANAVSDLSQADADAKALAAATANAEAALVCVLDPVPVVDAGPDQEVANDALNQAYAIYWTNGTGFTNVYDQYGNVIVSNQIVFGPYNFNLGSCAIDTDGVVYVIDVATGQAQLKTFQSDGTLTPIGTPTYPLTKARSNCLVTKEGRIVGYFDNNELVMMDKDGTFIASVAVDPFDFSSPGVLDKNNRFWIFGHSLNGAGNSWQAISLDEATFGDVIYGGELAPGGYAFVYACTSRNTVHVFTQTFFAQGPTHNYDMDTGVMTFGLTPPVRMYGATANLDGTKFWGSQKNDVFGTLLYYYDGTIWGTVDTGIQPIYNAIATYDQDSLIILDANGAIQRWDISASVPVFQSITAPQGGSNAITYVNNWNLINVVLQP